MTEAEFAAELRMLARRLRALRFRGTEAYLQDLDALAHAMMRRANEISAAPPAPTRAPEHARLVLRQTRVVGPTGAVATVVARQRRAGGVTAASGPRRRLQSA